MKRKKRVIEESEEEDLDIAKKIEETLKGK